MNLTKELIEKRMKEHKAFVREEAAWLYRYGQWKPLDGLRGNKIGENKTWES